MGCWSSLHLSVQMATEFEKPKEKHSIHFLLGFYIQIEPSYDSFSGLLNLQNRKRKGGDIGKTMKRLSGYSYESLFRRFF